VNANCTGERLLCLRYSIVAQGHCDRNIDHLRSLGSPGCVTDSLCHPEQSTYQLLFGLISQAAKRSSLMCSFSVMTMQNDDR